MSRRSGTGTGASASGRNGKRTRRQKTPEASRYKVTRSRRPNKDSKAPSQKATCYSLSLTRTTQLIAYNHGTSRRRVFEPSTPRRVSQRSHITCARCTLWRVRAGAVIWRSGLPSAAYVHCQNSFEHRLTLYTVNAPLSAAHALAVVDATIYRHEFINIFRHSHAIALHPSEVRVLELLGPASVARDDAAGQVFLARDVMSRLQKFAMDARRQSPPHRYHHRPRHSMVFAPERMRS